MIFLPPAAHSSEQYFLCCLEAMKVFPQIGQLIRILFSYFLLSKKMKIERDYPYLRIRVFYYMFDKLRHTVIIINLPLSCICYSFFSEFAIIKLSFIISLLDDFSSSHTIIMQTTRKENMMCLLKKSTIRISV